MTQNNPFSIIVLILITFISTSKTFAQPFDPSILILTPAKIEADKTILSEIKKKDQLYREKKQERIAYYEKMISESADRTENIRIIQQKNLEFMRDFESRRYISYLSSDYLVYRFFERFKNSLIYPIQETCSGSVDSLKTIAAKYQTQYVLNFPEINSSSTKKGKRSVIRIQLFDLEQNKVLLDEEFEGTSENPGFEFTCEEGSFLCTINNAIAPALEKVTRLIAANNKTLIKEKELASERTKILNTVFTKEPDDNITRTIIHHSKLDPKGYFQGFQNEDKTKFVGFFAVENGQKEEDEKNVTIIMGNESDPPIKAFVIVGLFYNNQWYIEKSNIVFFEAQDFSTGKSEYFNRLQEWNYFKENTMEVNPDFWETNFFKKVPDVRLEPDYEKYAESIYKSRERENKDYIGMYELVADKIREEKRLARDQFANNLAQKHLLPFLENKKAADASNFASYSSFRSDYVFIYPKDLSIAICPVNTKATNGQFTLRYFAIIPSTGKIYEWTYFKSLTADKKFSGSDIVDQMGKISEWNFGFDTFDDSEFWNKYVLLQESGKYSYLK